MTLLLLFYQLKECILLDIVAICQAFCIASMQHTVAYLNMIVLFFQVKHRQLVSDALVEFLMWMRFIFFASAVVEHVMCLRLK